LHPTVASRMVFSAMNTPNVDTTAGAKSVPETTSARSTKKSVWWKRGPNLVQHTPTGTFYARAKIKGKLYRQSLLKEGETEISLTTAKQRVGDKVKEFMKPKAAVGTFKEARLLYETDLENDHTLAPASKQYRLARIAALLKSWPGLDDTKLVNVSIADCKEWAKQFAAKWDEQNFNNTLGTFRAIMERGGVTHDDNPARRIKRLGVKATQLELPEPEQFDKLLDAIENPGKYPEDGHKASKRVAPQSKDCADLVRFLAFSGCRISEARQVTWADVDFDRGEIKVHNAKRSRTSNAHELRFVPIIPPMRELLDKLRIQKPEPTDRVCVLGECEKSLTRACERIKIPRITHHDLRHLFATRCIEAGVDIPTVSRWLGHVDGGALAMRVYGHLRREHSAAMAAKVTFGQSRPDNVVPMPKEVAI
jgi:integrase